MAVETTDLQEGAIKLDHPCLQPPLVATNES